MGEARKHGALRERVNKRELSQREDSESVRCGLAYPHDVLVVVGWDTVHHVDGSEGHGPDVCLFGGVGGR
jgi:hypothetical protein